MYFVDDDVPSFAQLSTLSSFPPDGGFYIKYSSSAVHPFGFSRTVLSGWLGRTRRETRIRLEYAARYRASRHPGRAPNADGRRAAATCGRNSAYRSRYAPHRCVAYSYGDSSDDDDVPFRTGYSGNAERADAYGSHRGYHVISAYGSYSGNGSNSVYGSHRGYRPDGKYSPDSRARTCNSVKRGSCPPCSITCGAQSSTIQTPPIASPSASTE